MYSANKTSNEYCWFLIYQHLASYLLADYTSGRPEAHSHYLNQKMMEPYMDAV